MNQKTFLAFLAYTLLFSGCVDQSAVKNGEHVNQSQDIVSTTVSQSLVSSTTTTTATTSSTTTTSTTTITTTTTSSTTTTFSPLKVEVVFFFSMSPCANCIKVGELAEETVNTYYLDELSTGKLVFKKANYFDPQNRELVKKYGPESSSLWIGTYVDGKFYKEMKIGVWYKTGNAGDYMEYLKGSIDKRLAGDLT